MKPTLSACAGSVVGQGLKGSDRVRESEVLNLLQFSPFSHYHYLFQHTLPPSVTNPFLFAGYNATGASYVTLFSNAESYEATQTH